MEPIHLEPEMEYGLGYLYFYGIDMEQDYAKAFKWLYSAIELGRVQAELRKKGNIAVSKIIGYNWRDCKLFCVN